MKSYRKCPTNRQRTLIIGIIVFCICVACPCCISFASMKNTDSFSIEIDWKINAASSPLEVSLLFTDVREDFQGDISLSIPYDGTDYILLSKELYLQKGNNERVDFDTGMAENSRLIRIDIRDRGGKLVFQHDILLTEEESKLIWKLQCESRDYVHYRENLLEYNSAVQKKPVLSLYFAVLLVYICVILPGVFIILKKKDKMHYLREMLAVVSIIFAGLIFVMSSGTRLTAPSLKYIMVEDYSSGSRRDDIYMSIQVPYSQEIQLTFDNTYTASGLYFSEHHDKNSDVLYEHYRYSLYDGKKESGLYMDTSVAVTPMYFKLSSEDLSQDMIYSYGSLKYKNDMVSGIISDNLGKEYDEVVLYLDGHIIELDTSKKEWELSECPLSDVSNINSDILRGYLENVSDKDGVYLVGVVNNDVAEFVDGAEEFDIFGITIVVSEVRNSSKGDAIWTDRTD